MADPTVAIDPATLHHAAGSPYMGMHHHAAPVDLFALVESYRTGILVLDGVLVLLVPILVQQLIMLIQTDGDKSNTLLPTIWKWLRGQDTWVIRTIEVTERFTRDGYRSWDYEQTNHLLQKAISLYLADVLTFEKESAKFELFTKPVDPEQRGKEPEDEEDTMGEDEEEEFDYSGESEIATLAVKTLPLKDRWIEVEKGVEFMHQEETSTSGSEGRTGKETKITFKFASKQKDGSARIEALIAKAFAQYQEMERAKVKDDTARYFYIQSGTKAASGDDAKTVVAYKRYALGEEKTFENLFFDQKQQVLQLLDSFANKTGKFSIKGFPYKLGFLLHGPPGTGKTSLIKAIAHHTKRHIVTINLGKIKSNQELMDAIFDLKFAVDGLDSPVEYSFKDVIFVMEDIDCASSIVNKRTDDASETKKSDKLMPTLSTRSADKVLMKIAETKSLSDAGGDKEGTTELTESSDAAPVTEEKKLMKMMLKMVMDDEKKSSELNLAGLLNVLDGVIDCPGRIIVMTTNHPEKLDPALIRPGRINKKLLLSYMNAAQVRQMIEYYTQQSLSEALMARLEKVFAVDEKLVSPAEVEEMCAEFDSTDKIVEALEKVAFASRF